MQIAVTKVFLNPKDNYSIVSEASLRFDSPMKKTAYLVTNDASGKHAEQMITSFKVAGAARPVWFKQLKQLGINLTPETTEINVEFINVDEFSYKGNDGTYTKVSANDVFSGSTGDFAMVGGMVQKLYKRAVKSYSIEGINVGNEYQYQKLLGFEQPKK